MKTIIYLGLLALNLNFAFAATPTVLICKVTSIVPEYANFFVTNGSIAVGDELLFDFSAKEVDRLVFKSGNQLPFYEYKSKFTVKKIQDGLTIYTGIHQGNFSKYRGTLHAYHYENEGNLFLQVLREQGDLYTLHTAEFTCELPK